MVVGLNTDQSSISAMERALSEHLPQRHVIFPGVYTFVEANDAPGFVAVWGWISM
jgi:hypothetical protein